MTRDRLQKPASSTEQRHRDTRILHLRKSGGTHKDGIIELVSNRGVFGILVKTNTHNSTYGDVIMMYENLYIAICWDMNIHLQTILGWVPGQIRIPTRIPKPWIVLNMIYRIWGLSWITYPLRFQN